MAEQESQSPPDWVDLDGHSCTPGCPDDVCRHSGRCAWPAGGPTTVPCSDCGGKGGNPATGEPCSTCLASGELPATIPCEHQWRRLPVVEAALDYECTECGHRQRIVWVKAHAGKSIDDLDQMLVETYGGAFAGEG